MTLTLVELAEAIEDGKTIESVTDDGEWQDMGHIVARIELLDAADWLKQGRLRIKPEAREYWLVGGFHFLSLKDAQIERAKGRYEEIIHVREVLQ